MAKTTNKTLGFSFSVKTPDSVEEFNRLAGNANACLQMAVRHVLYHNWNPTFRRALCKAIEEASGVKRPQQKDGSGNPVFADAENKVPVLVSEKIYLKQIKATGAMSGEALQALAAEVAGKVPFEASASKRGRKPNKEHVAAAQNIIDAINRGDTTMELVKEKFEALNEGLSFDELIEEAENELEALAAAVKINEDRKAMADDFLG